MGWWSEWKKKHWEPTFPAIDPDDPFPQFFPDFPPLRRAWNWYAKLWAEHPLGVIQTFAAVAAAVVAVIALLR